MKKFAGYFCRVYGNENTHLVLSEKADKISNVSDPLTIYEREIDVEDENGNIIGSEYRYALDGVITTQDYTRRYNWVTEAEVNELLEDLADEFADVENDN